MVVAALVAKDLEVPEVAGTGAFTQAHLQVQQLLTPEAVVEEV